jgi:serine/threonine protein kinase
MTPERYRRIDEIADEALTLEAPQRTAFLDRVCEGDPELRNQVERLLKAHKRKSGFMDSPAIEAAAREIAESYQRSLEGTRLGHYEILQMLGAGGMGEVYLAQDLKLGRKVALKLLPQESGPDISARRRFLREARAASALNHPNIVTIHTIEQIDGRDLIVMEYVSGETLKSEIDRGPLRFERIIELGAQVADALAAAHAAGLIHRDVKPANILVTPQVQAKVVDFGLAKRFVRDDATASASATGAGLIVGTAAYMSPEQTRGEELDERSDIFSLGCVLYEAATGKRPFDEPSVISILREIAEKEPPPPRAINPGLPREFDAIVRRALAKDKLKRTASAAELADALRNLLSPAFTEVKEKRLRSRSTRLAAVCTMLALLGIAAWFYLDYTNRQWARDAIARAEELTHEEKFAEAYDLATRAQRYIPNDPALLRLLPIVSDDLSVDTEPTGATVYLRRYDRDSDSSTQTRRSAGVTPIANLKIARGDYIVEIEKQGYAPVQRMISSSVERMNLFAYAPHGFRREAMAIETQAGGTQFLFDADAPIRIKAKLNPASNAPERMAGVPGGEYRLVNSDRLTRDPVILDDYFIDRFETTNREYAEFINSGGYLDRRFWKHAFVKDGRTLSWEEAMAQFRDRTGLPGPRQWSGQKPPEGKEQHPVTDVTWYEAAAYAEFRGKKLPTIYQWDKAARNGVVNQITGFTMPWGLVSPREILNRRANISGTGTIPVGSLEFGLSPYGCHDMAGNVAEWLLNAQGDGFTTAGGSWKDPPYLFSFYGEVPAWSSASTLGFRLVLNSPDATGDQGAARLNPERAVPAIARTSESEYRALLRHFEYDRTLLDARVVDVKDADAWRMEKISFIGHGGERTFAYLFLPKNASPPYQVIHYYPSGATDFALSVPAEIEVGVASLIKAGRAVFSVVLKGYVERPFPQDFAPPALDSVRAREIAINRVVDCRRGLDYLLGREEIDSDRLAYLGFSVSQSRLSLIGIETRYRAIVLMGAGRMLPNLIPEADGANYLPHVKPPKLWIHGRHDEAVHFRTEAEPLYKLLSQPKRLALLDGGHLPPHEVYVPLINSWLDETLGPVRRK